MQLNLQIGVAQCTDRLIELNLALVELDTLLLLQRFSDLLGRDGAEQSAALSRFRLNDNRQLLQPIGECLGVSLLLSLALSSDAFCISSVLILPASSRFHQDLLAAGSSARSPPILP